MLNEIEQKQFTQVCWEHIWAAVGMHALYRAAGAKADARSAAVSVRDLIEVAPAYRECWKLVKPTIQAQGFRSFIAIVEQKPAAAPRANSAHALANPSARQAARRASKCRKHDVPLAKLIALTGKHAGLEIELTKAVTQLGHRGRHLVAILRQDEGYSIVLVETGKLGDRPLVNGVDIGTTARPLHDNDIVEIAGIRSRFSLS